MIYSPIIFSLVVAMLLSWQFAKHLSRVAQRIGLVDRPDGGRKSQETDVSSAGGLAVALAATAAVVASIFLFSEQTTSEAGSFITSLLPAAAVLLVVGLVDDFIGLTGIYKLIGQILAASLLLASGLHFDYISLFWTGFSLGSFGIPFTIFFILGAINAFNLIDGIDGLASSIGAIVSLTLGIITAAQGDVLSAIVCFSFAGALLGFLKLNAPPAKMYLGDTGSMLIGLIVAAVAIHCSIKEQTAFALMVPIAICAIPILDAAAALIRRITTGQSVFAPDRGHLHHALLLRGWSVGKTVAFIAGLTAITCGGALLSFFTNQEAYALIATVGVFITLALSRIFGHSEARLVFTHARSGLHSMVQKARRLNTQSEKSIRIQGDCKWENLWEALREHAQEHELSRLSLNINIPRLHESYFADWKLNGKEDNSKVWNLELPLEVDGECVGQIKIAGSCSGEKGLLEMQRQIDFLEPIHDEIAQIILNNTVQETREKMTLQNKYLQHQSKPSNVPVATAHRTRV